MHSGCEPGGPGSLGTSFERPTLWGQTVRPCTTCFDKLGKEEEERGGGGERVRGGEWMKKKTKDPSIK